MTQPEPGTPKVWQPAWKSDNDLNFLGDILVNESEVDEANASIDDVVATGEDHD